jgi:predicted MFS family arabinose efflux permease
VSALDTSRPGGEGTVGPILRALVFAVFAVMPPFVTGAFSVSIRADVGFGPGALGGAIAVYFFTSSLLAVTGGATVERLGPRIGLAVGGTLSAISLASIALAPRYSIVLIAMAIGGVSNAITQPGVGALLSQRIPAGRLGLAFGIKQAGIPGATLLGGVLVPTAATTFGWRPTMGVLAALALIGSIAVLRSPADGAGVVRRRPSVRSMDEFRSLAILAVGGALGSGAATAVGTFLVGAAVATGDFTESSGGVLLAGGSLLGLVMRVMLGWLMDVRPTRSRYGVIVGLLLLGTPGFLLFTIETPAAYVVGTFIAFAAGWSWAGLAQYAVVSQNPATPALATGVLQTGMSLGAGTGPLLFGLVVQAAGYRAAWLVAATMAGLAAVIIQFARVHLRRTRERNAEAFLSQLGELEVDDAGFMPIADGVDVQQRRTANLDVTVMRLAPGADYVAPVPTRTGTLLNMGAHDIELELNGERQLCAGGLYRTVPGFRRWRVANPGATPVLVARVEHRTSGNDLPLPAP